MLLAAAAFILYMLLASANIPATLYTVSDVEESELSITNRKVVDAAKAEKIAGLKFFVADDLTGPMEVYCGDIPISVVNSIGSNAQLMVFETLDEQPPELKKLVGIQIKSFVERGAKVEEAATKLTAQDRLLLRYRNGMNMDSRCGSRGSLANSSR